MDTPYAIVMTACGDPANARMIAKSLVEKRLAACVQIIPMESFYRWEGEVKNDPELMLFCKIMTSDYAAVEAMIRAGHTYQTPEIILVSIEAGEPNYLAWIAQETKTESH
jgi:periplasmic divalent cation tolerance protein